MGRGVGVVGNVEGDCLDTGGGPATGGKVDANKADRVAVKGFATEGTRGGETGRGLFDYFLAAVLAEDVPWRGE